MVNEKRLIDPYDLTIHLAKKNAKHPLQYDDVLAVIADEKRVDAVEVVLCSQCKHWKKCESSLIGEVMCCTGQGSVYIQKGADDFCSCGERRNDV